MTTLLSIEWLKLVKRPMTWLLLGVQVGIFALGTFANVVSLRQADAGRRTEFLQSLLLPNGIGYATQFIYQFGVILLALLAAAAIGSEYSWGTLRPLLATGVSRTRWLAAKALALALVALGFVGVPLLLTLPVALIVAQMEQVSPFVATIEVVWLLGVVARTYLLIMMPMTLAFLIALVTRSQAVGVGAALLLVVADQIGAPVLWAIGTDWSLELVQFFPFWCARSLLAYNFPPTVTLPSIPNTMDESRAIITLIVYLVGCLVAAGVIFRRRDVGGAV